MIYWFIPILAGMAITYVLAHVKSPKKIPIVFDMRKFEWSEGTKSKSNSAIADMFFFLISKGKFVKSKNKIIECCRDLGISIYPDISHLKVYLPGLPLNIIKCENKTSALLLWSCYMEGTRLALL
ncbi:MAG: hypothetical protein QXL16_00390 [Candidatus Micrarchaeaceae archaeon]